MQVQFVILVGAAGCVYRCLSGTQWALVPHGLRRYHYGCVMIKHP